MAKAKIKNKQLPTAAPEKTEITGDHIPTPQDLPQRKPSLVASKLAGWCRHTLDSPLQHLPDLTLSTQVCNITSPSPHSTTCPLPPNPTQQEPTPSKLANWYLQFLVCLFSTQHGPVTTTSYTCFCSCYSPKLTALLFLSSYISMFLFIFSLHRCKIHWKTGYPNGSVIRGLWCLFHNWWASNTGVYWLKRGASSRSCVLHGWRALVWSSGSLNREVCVYLYIFPFVWHRSRRQPFRAFHIRFVYFMSLLKIMLSILTEYHDPGARCC